MTVRLSTGFRDKSLNSQFNTGAGQNFDSGILEYRTGVQPASADDAPVGVVVASITTPADAFNAAAAGAVAKNGTWQDPSADNTGVPTWFRFRESTDGGGSSTTDRRIDGSVTATGGGGDLTLNDTSIVATQVVTQDTFTVTQPAS